MRKITLFILFISGFGNMALAQEFDWVFIPPAEEGNTAFISPKVLEKDGHGNVYMSCVSSCQSISFGDYEFEGAPEIEGRNYLVKFDSTGNVQWVKSTKVEETAYTGAIAFDTPGNVYTAGFFHGSYVLGNITLETEENQYCAFVAKSDPNGNIIWAKKPATTGEGFHGIEADGMALDPEGNIYVVGRMSGDTAIFGNITVPIVNNSDFFIAKFDNNGDALWVQTIQNHSVHQIPSHLVCDSSGNLYMCGSYNNTLSIGNTTYGTEGESSTFMVKYNPEGNLLWANSNTVSESDIYAIDIAMDTQNNVYTAGNFYMHTVSFNGIEVTNSDTEWQSEPYVAKYDTYGVIQWAKTIGGSIDNQYMWSIDTAGGNIYVSGYFDSDVIHFGETTFAREEGGTSSFIGKFDTDGNYLWAEQIEGQSVFQRFITVDTDTNSLYASGIFDNVKFGGQTFNASVSTGSAYVARYDIGGGLANAGFNKETMSLYPNPAKNILNINNESALGQIYAIIDMTGRTIKSGIVENAIDISSLSSGLYTFTTNNVSAKFVKE
ncbi:T9SS type A sorting domain-containing protein [Flavobacterium sp. DGU11]|uniref:T9SS type A sorting domain-containing protein n=1 Tax=Flavobacterium arundinis TaxID=3139143 RepID=A0ABU9HSX9_9FLAO